MSEPVPVERIRLAKQLRVQGLSYRQIAERLGTVSPVARRYVLTPIEVAEERNAKKRQQPDGTWRCSRCKACKPRAAFTSSSKSWPNAWCTECRHSESRKKGIPPAPERLDHPEGGKICRTCRTAKPMSEFSSHPSGAKGRLASCKPCVLSRRKPVDLTRVTARGRTVAEERRDYRLRRNYGIDLDTFRKMLSEQGNCCAICLRDITETAQGKSVLVANVDHCHATGRVRGLLCSPCNVSIGGLADDPDRLVNAILYLRGALPPSFAAAFIDELRPLVEQVVADAARELA